jgi:hypothetical protein
MPSRLKWIRYRVSVVSTASRGVGASLRRYLEGQMSESTAPSSPALLGHKRSFCDSPKADSTLQEENRQQMLRRRTDLNDSNEGAESPDAMTTV